MGRFELVKAIFEKNCGAVPEEGTVKHRAYLVEAKESLASPFRKKVHSPFCELQNLINAMAFDELLENNGLFKNKN